MARGDIILDCSNEYYGNTERRQKELARDDIYYVDAAYLAATRVHGLVHPCHQEEILRRWNSTAVFENSGGQRRRRHPHEFCKSVGSICFQWCSAGLKATPLNPLAARVEWVDHNPLNISV
jgi:hypothetical protein